MAGLPRIADYPMPTAADLPAARVGWTLEPQRAALLVHDMQRYFIGAFDRSGPLVDTLIANVDAIRRAADASGVPVFYTAQPGDQDPALRGLQADFWGPGMTSAPEHQQIVEPLMPRPSHHVLTKWRYSAFERSSFGDDLKALGRDQLIVTGVYASIGCLLTAAQAFMRDVQPFVVADAVADFTRARHDEAIAYLAGRCAVVLPAADVVARLTTGAETSSVTSGGQETAR
ncbi:MAG: isochorismatase family protein [Vicinamibacterales bacterium]